MITIYCVACAKEVEAQALFGDSIYPHRPDLYSKKFLQCPHCGNYVGTHQDGRPLGTIPTPELRAMRNKVHAVIDEYWLPERSRGKRKMLYRALSRYLGREYHTGELNSIEECERVIGFYSTKFIYKHRKSGREAHSNKREE